METNLKSKGRLQQGSQCAKIVRALVRANGNWVQMPALVRKSGSYNVHTRVDELRRVHGLRIENRTDTRVRPHVSKYRLLPCKRLARLMKGEGM